jgi:hypothetical protein
LIGLISRVAAGAETTSKVTFSAFTSVLVLVKMFEPFASPVTFAPALRSRARHVRRPSGDRDRLLRQPGRRRAPRPPRARDSDRDEGDRRRRATVVGGLHGQPALCRTRDGPRLSPDGGRGGVRGAPGGLEGSQALRERVRRGLVDEAAGHARPRHAGALRREPVRVSRGRGPPSGALFLRYLAPVASLCPPEIGA